jgi:hypothetical protein
LLLPIFLSSPKTYLDRQEEFLTQIELTLYEQDLQAITLGRSEYDLSAPLIAIRRLMAGCCGLMSIAFRRTHLIEAVDRPASDRGEDETNRADEWLTSPYCQIEPAMAFQIGLPVLIWRESGVVADGVLDRGALGISMPEFSLDAPPNLKERQWKQPLQQWIEQIRGLHQKRGNPVQLW